MSILQSNALKSLFPEKAFWMKVLRFSIPVALQNMSSAILGIIDVSIISGMGETAVAAVSLANQLFYIVSLITFGITSGASVYLARYYGQKNPASMRQTFSLMLFFTVIINLIIMVFCLALPETAIRFFTDDAETIKGGIIYLVIIAPMFVIYSASSSFVSFFRSVNQPRVPMIATIVSLSIKVLLNLALIYGFAFIPAMGIAGAAVSSLTSKVIELMVYLFFAFRFKEKEYLFRFSDVRLIKPAAGIEFLKQTYPVIINESMWGIGISAFNAIFGRMGTSAVSAVSIARQLENLGNAFFYGIGIGACVSISFAIGQKHIETAKEEAKKYALAGFYVGIGIMLLMLMIDIPYVKFFFSGIEPGTQRLTMSLIAVYAVYMPFRSLASVLIMGVLRAGGDSKKGMLYDVVPVYIWSLLLGFILGIKLHLSITVVLAVMMFKRFIKCAFALRRVASGKWINYEEIGMTDNQAEKVK